MRKIKRINVVRKILNFHKRGTEFKILMRLLIKEVGMQNTEWLMQVLVRIKCRIRKT